MLVASHVFMKKCLVRKINVKIKSVQLVIVRSNYFGKQTSKKRFKFLRVNSRYHENEK